MHTYSVKHCTKKILCIHLVFGLSLDPKIITSMSTRREVKRDCTVSAKEQQGNSPSSSTSVLCRSEGYEVAHL